jgi:hypothetical protein
VSGTSDSKISRVQISDLGDARDGRAPGGAHVHLSAFEQGDDKAGNLPTGVPTQNNVIEDSVFLDSGFKAEFGVRMIINYLLPESDGQYSIFLSGNTVRNNVFRGFHWNAVEIAGPGTRRNTVTSNEFYGARQDALDNDKGAKFNLYNNNLVDGMTQGPGNAATAGIRDQGLPPQCSGGVKTPSATPRATCTRTTSSRT